MKRLVIILSVFFNFIQYSISTPEKPKEIKIEGFTQGTYYSIIYMAKDTLVTHEEIEQYLDDFLKTASLWEKNSIISKINRNEPVTLNDHFKTIFNVARKISQLTNGAFDITVGNLVNAWGFGSKSLDSQTKITIDSLRQFVGFAKVDILDNVLIKENPKLEIDFNAIAKGYSVDLIAGLLTERGLNSFLVDIGGEIRASGSGPDGELWLVGIEKPTESADSERQVQTILQLTNISIATSGTYRKYYEKGGMRFSHTIDPETGYPVSHNLLSVTVIAEKCVEADALATAFMVMGMDKSLQFLSRHPEYDAYFIRSEKDGKIRSYYSKGFQKFMYR